MSSFNKFLKPLNLTYSLENYLNLIINKYKIIIFIYKLLYKLLISMVELEVVI